MKTIKVIDLLDRIAKDEAVPEKIKYRETVYYRTLNDYMGDEPITRYYVDKYGEEWFEDLLVTLDTIVEIIEEDKKIEKPMHEHFEYKKLQEENERLKKQLSGTTFCYDEEEHRKLKEQLEECQLQNINLREDIMIKKISLPDKAIKDISFWCLYDMPTYEELLECTGKNNADQKEFIKYLEDEINNCTKQNDIFFVGMQRAFKLSLKKYKEIIEKCNELSNKPKPV